MQRRILLLFVLLVGLAPGGAGADEGLAWRVAADDFVCYRITVVERSDSEKGQYARWGEIDDVAGFHGYQLERDGRRVLCDVTHPELLYVPFVFWLPDRLAVGAKDRIRLSLGGNWRLEPLEARGEVRLTALEPEGSGPRAGLEGEVTFSAGPSEGVRAYRRLTEGRLTWSARFDLERGLMEEVAYELSWTTEDATDRRPPGVHGIREGGRSFHAKVRLELAQVLAHRYARFQRDVDAAIEQGLLFLEEEQQPDGSWERGRNSVGLTALALLALLDGGRAAEEASVERGFSWLLRQRPWEEGNDDRTYSIGIALMAIERLRTPLAEIERRRRGAATEFLPRRLRGFERAWATRAAGFLLETARVKNARDDARPVTGSVTDEAWRWRYPSDRVGRRGVENDWDNSNSQYAVLGLESAARCGVQVPDRVWFGIANHFLAVQAADGPLRRDLRIVRRKFLDPDAKAAAEDGHTYAPEPVRARARGWSYFDATAARPRSAAWDGTYGSMTAAGVASLAIARSRILRLEHARRHGSLLDTIDEAILDGFASLDAMFTVWTHPGHESWYTYYLYGLERAGMLTGIERFGEHDWYWEGAVQLLLRQSSYGTAHPKHWVYDHGALASTCWAILFLKRGTPPVVTPR